MALGSSAPEILLNCIETVQNLGKVPGELGPSTIVGSAAFNLILISAVSIYCVNEDSDERTDKEIEEDKTPKGVKKINDLGVFACTTTFSVLAYVWLYVSLLDGYVSPFEAWLTFALFFIMIGIAYVLDKMGQRRGKEAAEKLALQLPGAVNLANIGDGKHAVTNYTPLEFFNTLIPVESGTKVEPGDQAKVDEMKGFLKHHFNTDKVQNIDINDLK